MNEPSYLKVSADEQEVTHENLVLIPVKHNKAAWSQKILVQQKIDNAKRMCEQSPGDSKITTLVVDCCQNLDLPHPGGEQTGDTYYFSLIWLDYLGVVNIGEDKLYTYLYEEHSGKKEMNNVASLLMHYIKNYLLNQYQHTHHNCPKDEWNNIMYNCRRQNKNNTIDYIATYLCEVGYFKTINLIFLCEVSY